MIYDLSNIIESASLISRFNKLNEDNKVVELKEIKPKRSIKQNAYLHVIFQLFGIHFGLTLDESKTELKRQCPFMKYEKKGKPFLKKTSKMDSKELTEFVDWVRNFSSTNGCYLPSSEQYLEGQVSIDKTISQHKQYL